MIMSEQGFKSKQEYHCSYPNCLYSAGSERYFSSKHLLNQHIAKVHAEKKYICSKCNKGFGLDWWRKYHEVSCGKEWKCPCGLKYLSRESLLTHARRSQHTLPADIYNTSKKNGARKKSNQIAQPVVFLIQPIIQQPVTLIVSSQENEKKSTVHRPILPKHEVSSSLPCASNVTSALLATQDSLPFIESHTEDNTDQHNKTIHSDIRISDNSMLAANADFIIGKKCSSKSAAETQTCNDLLETALRSTDLFKQRESRASQCSWKSAKHKSRFQSACTQTMESAVVKMKKKSLGSKSRRKSVAVTTEPEIAKKCTTVNHSSRQTFHYICNSGYKANSWHVMNKHSSATQTCSDNNKAFCDSQTLTDDLLSFCWSGDIQATDPNASLNILTNVNEPSSSSSSSEFIITSPELPSKSELLNQSVSAFQNCTQSAVHNSKINLPSLVSEQFSEKIMPNSDFTNCLSDVSSSATLKSKEQNLCMEGSINIDRYRHDDLNGKIISHALNFESAYEKDFAQGTVFDISAAPELSHIQTQTNLLTFDYNNIFSNMETQTTDDFLFPDLEFSDTETQTPWEDISMNDSLTADQLSIEIQTDFSSFMIDDNTPDLISDLNFENILQNCENKEPTGIHTETQTNDYMSFPQLTNSEAQTLEATNFLFN